MSKVYPQRRKVDSNQSRIVKALREAGYGVLDIHSIGKGAPDLVVSDDHDEVLVEVKRLGEPYTPDELKFAETWPGPIVTAITEHDVIAWFLMRQKQREEMPNADEMLRRYHNTLKLSGRSQADVLTSGGDLV